MMPAMRSGDSSVDAPGVSPARRSRSPRAIAVAVDGLARLRVGASAHPRAVLCVLALLPFLPGLWQILRAGVPDVLFTGDGATLELRTLHAAHGRQWLGPYSRYMWSHPGPAMFYLAVPFYEALGQRGPALNVFVFAASLASSVALALNARRLRGDFFALGAIVLLGLYQLVGVPYAMSSEWNPTVPMLPLTVLSVLGARLAVGDATLGVLLGFVVVGSAIVQTHVGFVPVVSAISAVALLWSTARAVWRWSDRRGRWRWLGPRRLPVAPLPDRERPGLPVWSPLAAALALAVCWFLPVAENLMTRPGNLEALYWFFASPHRPEHSWGVACFEVFRQMVVMPQAVARVIGLATDAELGWPAIRVCGILELAVVAGALGVGIRKRDPALAALAVLAVVEFLAALVSVREIRDEIHSYLVVWTSTLGFLVAVVAAAWLARGLAGGDRVRAAVTIVAGAGLVCLGLGVGSAFGHVELFRDRDVAVERLAREVEGQLAERHVHRPVVRIVSNAVWPAALAVVLDLEKHGVPVAVEKSWLHMVGKSLAARPGDRYGLRFGDAALQADVAGRLDHAALAAAGGVYAYLEDTHYLQDHRVLGDPAGVRAYDVRGDPRTVTDGVIPEEGTSWDSPVSLVLTSEASAVEIALPTGEDVVGVFLSADGNDRYALRCVGADGLVWFLGPAHPDQAQAGMRTRLLFSGSLPACRAIEVKPVSGDGAYSIGELGFLRR
jgi:hypothetical protein